MKRYFAFLLAAVALIPVTRALGLSLEVLNSVPYIIGVTY